VTISPGKGVKAMLSLSQTTGYAILALSCLVDVEDRWVLSKDIAAATGIPGPYLSRVLHELGRSGLIRAKRGYRGGFALARPASRISLLDVTEAVEGHNWKAPCLLGLTDCSQIRGCPTSAFWERELARIERELRKTTLAQVGACAGAPAGVLAGSGRAQGARTKSGGPRRGRAKRSARSPNRSGTKKLASRARQS
jgi:Rrf2 family protein